MTTAAENITRHFGGEWHGHYGTFPAPGHSERDRGMSVKDTPDGDVLINSFNGADPMDVKAECRRLGLIPDWSPPRDGKPPNGGTRRKHRPDPDQRITGAFEYTDVDGAVLYRTVRLEPGRDGRSKDFRAERPDGNGGWLPGLPKDGRRVLYRLADVAMTEQGVEPILLVEGERKADRLREWGFVATAVAFGCKGWRSEYAEALAGHQIVILPDQDEPGRAFAEQVRAALVEAGGFPRILTLPGLSTGGDIMDWTGSADDLRAMIDAPADEGEAEAAKPAGLPLPCELFDEIEPRLEGRWLVKSLLMASAATVVFGFPGCGKSFLALDLALHVAAGRQWFGRRVERGGVAYIAAEGQAGLRARVEAWKMTHGREPVPFALIPAAVDLLDPAADLAKLRTVLDHLSALWGRLDLLVIDTLAATFGGGDENGPDMAAYVANVESLCAPYGCARLIVTHVPLNGDAKRPRGHGSLWGASDTALHVSGDRDAPARRISAIKQKDADPGADILFTLKPVELGTDSDGEPVTSCVVEPSELEPGAVRGRRRLTSKEQIVMAALERAMADRGTFPPPEIPDSILNRTRTGKAISLSEWRSEALSALHTPDTKPDTARRTFDRAKESLQAAGIIGAWEDWAWLV